MKTKPMPRPEDDDGKVVPLHRPRAMPTELSDEALMAACGVGDNAALGALFDRYSVAVYRLVSRLLRMEPAEADDMVQMTFIEVWRGAKKYDGRGSVRSFVFGVAVNVVRHHFRSTKRRRDLLAEAPEPAPMRGPDDAAIRKQQVSQLAAALERLPHDLRVAYVMCDLEDIPGVEAARVLDVRQGTLWRRLHDARKALREALDESGGRV